MRRLRATSGLTLLPLVYGGEAEIALPSGREVGAFALPLLVQGPAEPPSGLGGTTDRVLTLEAPMRRVITLEVPFA